MSHVINVRAAGPGDLNAVHRLEEQLFQHGSYPYFFFRQALDALPDYFLVAEADNGEVIGYSLGSMQIGASHGWVLSVGVDPSYQGRGIGNVLTVDLLKSFERQGAQEAFLHVSPSNAAAITLYKKLGFEEVRMEEDYFGPGADRLIMRRKRLPQG